MAVSFKFELRELHTEFGIHQREKVLLKMSWLKSLAFDIQKAFL